MKRKIFSCLFLAWLHLPSSAFAGGDKERGEVFWQDKEFIYRSFPYSFDFDNLTFLPDLIQGASEEALFTVQKTLLSTEIKKNSQPLGAREKVLVDLDGMSTIQEKLETFNSEIVDLNNSTKQKFQISDAAPKALIIHAGLGGGGAFGLSISGSISVGFVLFIDRVDKIAKKELVSRGDLSQDYMASAFAELDTTFKEELEISRNSLGRSFQKRKIDGIPVATYYQIDVAPVIMLAPAIGAGIGGGGSIRTGLYALWWKGNKLMEPEDIYGWGLAYSHDVSGGVGYNFKAGVMNSNEVESTASWFDSHLDYFFAGISFAVGPQTEFSPIKGNIISFRPHTFLTDYLAKELEKSAESIADKVRNEITKELLEQNFSNEQVGNPYRGN